MKKIVNQNFPNERDLYNASNLTLENCSFKGEEDGESALKECKNVTLNNCVMDLRYPLWHAKKIVMQNCEQTVNCRASLWYVNNLIINNCLFNGIKS